MILTLGFSRTLHMTHWWYKICDQQCYYRISASAVLHILSVLHRMFMMMKIWLYGDMIIQKIIVNLEIYLSSSWGLWVLHQVPKYAPHLPYPELLSLSWSWFWSCINRYWSSWSLWSWPYHPELLNLASVNICDNQDPCHHDDIDIYASWWMMIMMIVPIVYPELPKFSSANRWFSFAFASCSPFCSFTHSSISKKLIC